jgi:hypothetical protein
MKNLSLIMVSAFLFLASCSKNELPEKELVFVPAGASELTKRMVAEIRQKPAPNNADYIQLAIIYSKYHEEPEIIRRVLEESLLIKKDSACYYIQGIVNLKEDWELAKDYRSVVEEVLAEHKCPEFVQE